MNTHRTRQYVQDLRTSHIGFIAQQLCARYAAASACFDGSHIKDRVRMHLEEVVSPMGMMGLAGEMRKSGTTTGPLPCIGAQDDDTR